MSTEISTLKKAIASELAIAHIRIPDHLLYRIQHDDLLLHHLMVCRQDEMMLNILLNEAPPEQPINNLPGNRQLLTHVARSVKNWAAANFEKTPLNEYQRRLSICNACPNKVKPDGRMLYRMIAPSYVCNLCGCDIERKAVIRREQCPDKHAAGEGRW